MEGEILQLFPIAVGQLQLRPVTDHELSVMEDELNNCVQNQGNITSANSYILNRPELIHLKADLTDLLNDYFQSVYKPRHKMDLYITQSWLNMTRTGEHHHSHRHYNSILSGVLYVDTQPGDQITFIREVGIDMFAIYSDEYNTFNAYTWDLEVSKDTLLLFPSSLGHTVNVLERPGRRISLAFNTFFTGKIGDINHLSELEI